MAEENRTETVDSTISSEEVVTAEEKMAAAKAATREAAQKSMEAVTAAAKVTAAKTAQKTKQVAKTAKKAVANTQKALMEGAEAAPKRKYTRKPKKTIIIQYMGQEISEEVLTDRAMAQFSATEGAVPVKKIALYIKPEDQKAYYVINDQFTGAVEI